jgi:hypothetical protein
MKKESRSKSRSRFRALTLPELQYSKSAVLNSLGSLESKRAYEHAMNEFIAWYCSEPRLALNRVVVLRYRLYLEGLLLAPATINVRLAAIRRLAYEAADNGLLSPELVAGIRRVHGPSNSVSASGIGSRPRRVRHFSRRPQPTTFVANGTRQSSRFCWGAVCAAQNWRAWRWTRSNRGNSAG